MQEKVGDTTSAAGEREYMMLRAGTAERLYAMVEVLFCSFWMRKPEAERITNKNRILTRLPSIKRTSLNAITSEFSLLLIDLIPIVH